MAEILRLTDSSYYPAFKKMYKDAIYALDEARDISMHLKPLRKHIEDIEQTEIPELHLLLPPLMHSIALLWTNSKHYCKPGRIVVLLQEIGNLFIELARNYLDPMEIFKGDSEECITKVELTIRILKDYKVQFENLRNTIEGFFKPGVPVKKWEFSSDLVFARYDQFLKRLELVNDVFSTAIEFSKLEKVIYLLVN